MGKETNLNLMKGFEVVGGWIAQSLSRKLVFGLAVIMAVSSALFLTVLIILYQSQLAQERGNASAQVNLLLQASLENAMLNRDIPGLKRIVRRLGRQKSIRQVMIINPKREVRFSSNPRMLHKVLSHEAISGCETCPPSRHKVKQISRFLTGQTGREVLRSVNPIFNKKPCAVCHGLISKNPVNGILIVDYEAGGIRGKAFIGATGLAGAGAFVVFLALAAAWLFLQRSVILPVHKVNQAARALAKGDFESAIPCEGQDEIARLCRSFNIMSGQLQSSMEEIRAQGAFLQSMIDAVPDGIRVIDEDYTIILANRAYKEQLQAKKVKGALCYASSHKRNEPCLPTLITCPLHEIKKAAKPIKTLHRHVRQDDSEIQVEIYAAPLIVSRDGRQKTYVVEAIRDLEAQVKVSQEQRLSELGQLATGIAHEIHNPLASVRLGLQALLKITGKSPDSDEIHQYLSQVDGEVDKCIIVTKRLLDISTPPSAHIQLVSISDIIPDVVMLLKFEALQRQVKVQLNLGKAPLRVLATDAELRMLTLNLMQNAFHAMPEGGELTIEGRSKAGIMTLTFADTGVGISDEHINHIFDPFFSHRADHIEGTGLGLSICKAILERYDGSIQVKSQPGAGSCFTITLPDADYPKDRA